MVDQLESAWQQVRRRGPADLAALHVAHLETLGASAPAPVDWRMPRRGVRQVEQQLHDQLVDAAMTAQSGDLARLLASMSAAVAQRLVTL